MKKDIINLINGENVPETISKALSNIYLNGSKANEDMEILSYAKHYCPEEFRKYENIANLSIGLFYKNCIPSSVYDLLFLNYRDAINDIYHRVYTPVQIDILNQIKNNDRYSFSSPTSTGKSHIIRELLSLYAGDIIIIVPSRALINEYFLLVSGTIKEKTTSILTYVDIINKRYTKRRIFILTPERAKDLFKHSEEINASLIIFDEAQLGNDTSFRGLYFDSIVRRCDRYFNKAKILFSQPFVDNPECQLIKNSFNANRQTYSKYNNKNIGQMFYSYDGEKYRHFSIAGGGVIRHDCVDPVSDALIHNKTVLFYCSKTSIMNKTVFEIYSKYINMCQPICDEDAFKLMKKFGEYIGGDDKITNTHYSQMIDMMKKGIIIHHGSLPLQARYIIEDFTRQGFCRMCFATSTLEQGINMPFDLVFLDRFEASKPLSVKNLIGRAGRSTKNNEFDYGKIVVKSSNVSKIITIMKTEVVLSNESELDNESDDDNADYKTAIKNGTFSEDYNLTSEELTRISNSNADELVVGILSKMFDENNEFIYSRTTSENRKFIRNAFADIYSLSLGRELVEGERSIVREACKIMVWKVEGKKFSNIVGLRFNRAAKTKERRELQEKIKNSKDKQDILRYSKELENLTADFTTRFGMLPNKDARIVSICSNDTPINNLDYDDFVIDTYDYLDKLIGFRFGDVFYATFHKFYLKTNDKRALWLSNFIKYGTNDEKEIMLLRYGFDFEDFNWLKDIVINISDEEIVFDRGKIKSIKHDDLSKIDKYIF